jgi:glutamate synthase (ferredoxin)
MSGGLAYVLDEAGSFARRCNHDAIDLEPVFEDDDVTVVRHLLERHLRYTGSAVATRLLEDWALSIERFVKVIPREYKKAVEAARAKEAAATRTTLLQVANG